MRMNTFIYFRRSLGSSAAAILLVAGGSPALAAGASVHIQYVSPTGAISPGTAVSFIASASGFTDPVYAVSDAFSASGSSVGTINTAGYFTWTPNVYDGGTHPITVTVTDNYNDSATATVNILVTSNSIIVGSLSPGPIVMAGRTVTFTAAAPGFIAPNYTVYDSFSRSTISSRNINSSGAFSWTPTTDDVGTHSLSVGASDVYGHSAQTIESITVIHPSIAIQSLKPGSAAGVGSPVSFVANAVSLASPSFSVSDSFNGTSTMATNNMTSAGVFTWNPSTADLGLHTLIVTATDSYGNVASTTLMISVTAAAPIAAETPASPPASANTPIPTATTTASPATTYVFTTYLAIGSRGAAVTELQKRLASLDFYTGPVTGYFGPLTSASVKKFQGAHGLSRVGFVGPGTRAALNRN